MPPTPHTVLPGTAQSGTAQSGVSRHCGRRPSPARRTPPCGGGSSCQRRPIQRHPAPCSPAPRSPASADTVTDDRHLHAAHLLAAVGRRANDAPYSVTRHRAVRHRAARSPCGGGSSCRRRPIMCCLAPRCLASADTAVGDHRLHTTRLLAAVGRRPDDAPYRVAHRPGAWRRHTLCEHDARRRPIAAASLSVGTRCGRRTRCQASTQR